jgi:2-hydroxychromene-2-carboxylate isomerase
VGYGNDKANRRWRDEMARLLDFYFDCSSPWTYLAFHAIQPIAAELGAEIAWKPILVGGVFNAVNQTVYDSRAKPNPLKQAYMLKDLGDWARLYGLKIVFPPTVFPVNSVKCMRGAFTALDEGKLVPYATAAFEAYWSDDRDIAHEDVLADIAVRAGLERQRFFAGIENRFLQGAAACQYRRADRARRLRQSDDVRWQLDVLWQRSPAAGEGGAGGNINSCQVLCRMRAMGVCS